MRTSVWIALGVGGALVIAAGASYWYATGGSTDASQAPSWLRQRPIAHRGLHTGDSERPENSLAAFRAAAEAGFSIELDVQMTSDGKLVVMHDANLKRMTGDSRDISQVSEAEVTRLRLLDSAETVPSLQKVFDAVGGRVPVFVEVKSRGPVGKLEDAVARELSAAPGPVAVMSFNPFSLARIAEKAPSIPRGQLSGTFAGEKVSLIQRLVLSALLMNWKSRPAFVAYQLRGLPSVGTWLQKRRGRPLLVWTARTKQDYDRASRIGDGVIFELAARPRG